MLLATQVLDPLDSILLLCHEFLLYGLFWCSISFELVMSFQSVGSDPRSLGHVASVITVPFQILNTVIGQSFDMSVRLSLPPQRSMKLILSES